MNLKVRCSLALLIPFWGWLNTLTGLRIGAIPQRRPACRGDARWLCLRPDVVQYLPDVGAVRDEGDDSHLPATDRAEQREHLIDTGLQHRPEIVRWALGQHRLSMLGLAWEWIAYPKCALARAGGPGPHLQRLRLFRHLRCCTLCQRHRRSPVRRVRRQYAEVAVAVRARRRHQGGNGLYQLQWREGDLVHLCAALIVWVAAWRAVLLGAAVGPLAVRFAQPLHRKRWTGAIPQQALQARGRALRCKRWCLPISRCGGRRASLWARNPPAGPARHRRAGYACAR